MNDFSKDTLSNIDRFDREVDIFVNKFTQQIFMICLGNQKNHLQKETAGSSSSP